MGHRGVIYSGPEEVMGVPSQVGVRFQPLQSGRLRGPTTVNVRDGRSKRIGPVADIDSGIAVAVMRNNFTLGDLQLAESIDTLISQCFGGSSHG